MYNCTDIGANVDKYGICRFIHILIFTYEEICRKVIHNVYKNVDKCKSYPHSYPHCFYSIYNGLSELSTLSTSLLLRLY